MPIYVSLINWTEQGIKNFRDIPKRAQGYTKLVEEAGGKVRELLWTVGEYDIVVVNEFPDDESSVAALLQLGAGGSVRTETLRGFDATEMGRIIERTT